MIMRTVGLGLLALSFATARDARAEAAASAGGAAPAARGASLADFDRRAREGERLTVVFFGASLTWGANATDHANTSYRARMAERMEAKYPQAHLRFHDGAIGGTGSQLGVFRVEHDVLRWKPDLVFLDFSANDDIHNDDPETLASYEAIMRRLIADHGVPVIPVIFPFKWNVDAGSTNGMKRLTAHLALSRAYGTVAGDAISLAIARVKSGEITTAQVWDTDGVHPGDDGYRLFADAAWAAFEDAVSRKLVCRAPAKMVYADTYMRANRALLSKVCGAGALPAGWQAGKPYLTALNYDWLMSRWLYDVTVANNSSPVLDEAGKPVKGEDGKPRIAYAAPAPLRFKVNASAVLVLGEASGKSGGFRVLIDGTPVTGKQGQPKDSDVFNANPFGGNAFLVKEVARGLDTTVDHTVEIVPVLAADKEQELRLESLCVAGGKATVDAAK